MDNEYADVNDIPGNIFIQPYMFESPQQPNNQESSEESDNGDEDDHYKFSTTKYCLAHNNTLEKKSGLFIAEFEAV